MFEKRGSITPSGLASGITDRMTDAVITDHITQAVLAVGGFQIQRITPGTVAP